MILNRIKKALIIAPHCDDEVLGCGGIISKYNKEINFNVLICTNANKGAPEIFSEKYINIVRSEAKSCHKFLGVKKTLFLDLPAPRLDQFPIYKVSNEIKKIIEINKFDTIFIPSKADLHVDHKIIFHASIVASRSINKNSPKNILSYETLSETDFGSFESKNFFRSQLFIRLNKKEINKKIKAFSFYKSQLKSGFHPRTKLSIFDLAKARGRLVNSQYCESFELIKSIDE